MTTPQEQFDEDIIKIMQFIFQFYYTYVTGNELSFIALRDEIVDAGADYGLKECHNISEDTFWNVIFNENIEAIFKWNIFILTIYCQNNTLQTSNQDIIDIFNDTTLLDDTNQPFQRSTCKNKDIGRYISLFYNTRYKDKIRQWAEDEFVFSPK